MIRDLLKRLLHHDPKKRISSMRQVLEHPFFSGGVQDDGFGLEQQVSPSNNGFTAASARGAGLQPDHQMFSQSQQQQLMDHGFGASSNAFDDIKFSQSGESLENRENGVRSGSSGRSSNGSARSSRSSFGGGFRKMARNPFRGNGSSNNVR